VVAREIITPQKTSRVTRRSTRYIFHWSLDRARVHHLSQDLEAQRIISNTSLSATINSSPETSSGDYIKTGRGGAGNFVSTSDAENPNARQAIENAIRHAKEKVRENQPVEGAAPQKSSGRGGAGNYRQTATEEDKRQAEEEERKLQSRVEVQVRTDVGKGLAMPQRAYMAPKAANEEL